MYWLGPRLRKKSLIKQLGPGLVTGAADDDPSGIATYSQAGAQFGANMLWTMALTYPLMSAVQLISAEIGRVTGAGLAKNMADIMPRWLVTILVAALFAANTINLGADLSAMGAVTQMTIGGGAHLYTIGFALLSLALQLLIPYKAYARILEWMTLVLLSYVAVLCVVKVDWAAAAHAIVLPDLTLNRATLAVILAIFGTTISPYLFFWQSAQEVEDIGSEAGAKALKDAPEQAPKEFRRMRIDTFVGMAVSNAVAIAIMLAAAATLHASGQTHVGTAADAAKALEPLAGPFAFALFALGIIGTGLLAVPILAGSAAFAIANARGWKSGLEYKPRQAMAFYTVIGLAILLGLGIGFSPLTPVRALFWSAVVNGVIAAPIMAAMMIVASRKDEMGQFVIGPALRIGGWLATAAMFAAVIAMVFAPSA